MKKRLDLILFEKGYFDSREKAKREIMAENVLINDKLLTKAGTMLKEEDILTIRIKEKLAYVSRGGLKLEGAIKTFKISFENKIVLDIGASTGGFTDCALQNKAKFVYSVDVGTNQLDYKLRINEKVLSIENTHINKLKLEQLIKGKADIVVADVSFISLTKIVKYIYDFSKENAEVVVLIKPQFEVGKEFIGKNGIVREEKYRKLAIDKVLDSFRKYKFKIIGVEPSPIKGTKGNIEYLLYLRKEENEGKD
ncbi:TlyA family RNA methyltransferase [Sneathia sanguinegens]|uniref:TlyA family RNA methyltransferase n=1 Tax=Sneathia sanguinegens TaxID=40543 RepID=UPI0008379512|nr:TlyA family RNA methyltransferase [Sneathia sanguinegens]